MSKCLWEGLREGLPYLMSLSFHWLLSRGDMTIAPGVQVLYTTTVSETAKEDFGDFPGMTKQSQTCFAVKFPPAVR